MVRTRAVAEAIPRKWGRTANPRRRGGGVRGGHCVTGAIGQDRTRRSTRFLVITPRRSGGTEHRLGRQRGAEVHRLGGHQDRRSRRGARLHCERGGPERLPTGASVARLFSDATGCRLERRSPQDGLLGTDCGDSLHPVVARPRGTDQAGREEGCHGRARAELPYGRATRPAGTIQRDVAVTWVVHLAPVSGGRHDKTPLADAGRCARIESAPRRAAPSLLRRAGHKQ